MRDIKEILAIGCDSGVAGIGSYMFAKGVSELTDYLREIDAIREAVYSSASEMTPEIIRYANSLADKVGFPVEATGNVGGDIGLLVTSYLLGKLILDKN